MKLLTAEDVRVEVARLTGAPPPGISTIHRWALAGVLVGGQAHVLASIRRGGRRYFARRAVRAFVEGLQDGVPAPLARVR